MRNKRIYWCAYFSSRVCINTVSAHSWGPVPEKLGSIMRITSVIAATNELRRIANNGRPFTNSELFEGDDDKLVGVGREFTTNIPMEGANDDGGDFSLLVVSFYDGQLYVRSALKWVGKQGDEHHSSARYLLDESAIEHLEQRADKLNALSSWSWAMTSFWESAFSQTRRFIKDTTRYGTLYEQKCIIASSDKRDKADANRAHVEAIRDAQRRHAFLCMLTTGSVGTVTSVEFRLLLTWVETQTAS